MLLFTACCGSTLVCAVYLTVRTRFSTAAACGSAALLLSTRVFQGMVFAIFPDALLAFLIFAAAVSYGRALERSVHHRFVFFGVLTLAAMLTHGRGALLLFLPFVVLLFRRERFTWKWPAAAAAVLLLCQLPHRLGQAGRFSPAAMLPITAKYFAATVTRFGWLGVLLALLGVTLIFRPGPARNLLAAVASIVLCNLALLFFLPVPFESRYLLPTFAALSTLAGAGLHLLRRYFASHTPALRRSVDALLIVTALACTVVSCWHVPMKSRPVYRDALAHGLLSGHAVALIGADSTDEGALIVESSLIDPLRTHTVLRASKMLSFSTWSGYDKQLLYATPVAIAEALRKQQVSLVLAQTESPPEEDVQLLAALRLDAMHWRRSANLPTQPQVAVFIWQP